VNNESAKDESTSESEKPSQEVSQNDSDREVQIEDGDESSRKEMELR
jgi:hypothetical protein